MAVVMLEDVCKIYEKDNEIIHALNHITVEFEQGKFYAITGNSGSGKTTLLQCIGSLNDITSGTIFINGVDIAKLDDTKLSEMRKSKIGFVFQSYYLNPLMKAYENVEVPMHLNKNISREDKRQRSFHLLEKVDMLDRMNHYPKELSGGEQQRVSIARALANNPDIILADEPTGNLDKNNEKKILEILSQLSKDGKCVIVVTHNEKVKDYADVLLKMEHGSLRKIS